MGSRISSEEEEEEEEEERKNTEEYNRVLAVDAARPLTSSQINGIRCGSSDCTIGLYADDIILTLSDVKTSLLPLLDLVKQFSGFTINWDKSLFMPLSGDLDSIFLKALPLKLATDNFKYLGINITRNPKLLFKHNYMELIDSTVDYYNFINLTYSLYY